jgi:ABC-type uncharacterized transport system permease subunit
MFSGITITCFAASYAVSLLGEISRLFFRAPVRMFVIVGFAAAGLFAHTIYLVALARAESLAEQRVVPLSSWFDWCLLAAWILAAFYLLVTLRRLEIAIGVFLLPLVLALIGLAVLNRHSPPFPHADALAYWRWAHGIALLLGTVAVTLGLAAGIMYLVQSYRLKHKLPPRRGFQLPSLERLQKANRRALVVSTVLLGVGLLSGMVLNLAARRVPWTDPVVVSSTVLLAWLVTMTCFESFYKPARQGRKVAYLTLASFIFLALALGLVLYSQHASTERPTSARPTGTRLTAHTPFQPRLVGEVRR